MLKTQAVAVAILAGYAALASAGQASPASAEAFSLGQDSTIFYSGPTIDFPNARARQASPASAEAFSLGQDPTVYYSAAPIVASGTVVGIDAGAKSVRLEHGSIRMINHPPMTMEVGVRNAKLLSGLQPGQQIVFELIEQNGQYVMARAR